MSSAASPSAARFPAEGGCDCGAVRYRVTSAPLIVHCCHCRWCQRESGAAFALNAMIESDRVENLGVAPELVHTPSASGRGQTIARCPSCRIAVWSHYAGSGPVTKFVRVGTLDDPDACPPDAHIFTASKQPWVVLGPGAPVFEVFYERERVWPAESLARRDALLPLIEAYLAARDLPGSSSQPPEPTTGADLEGLLAAGAQARRAGRLDEAQRHYTAALAACRSRGDTLCIAHTARHLGDIHRENCLAERAEPLLTEAIALYRGNLHTRVLDLANALRPLALLLTERGDTDAARPLWREARGLYSAVNVESGVAECDAHLAGG